MHRRSRRPPRQLPSPPRWDAPPPELLDVWVPESAPLPDEEPPLSAVPRAPPGAVPLVPGAIAPSQSASPRRTAKTTAGRRSRRIIPSDYHANGIRHVPIGLRRDVGEATTNTRRSGVDVDERVVDGLIDGSG
jgi:hypothetical protein